MKANICPRPWERYQFIRGSQNSYLDILFPDQGFRQLLQKINDFYLKELEIWVHSKVDAIGFMDDWGAQNALLIDPEMWRYYFKPIYKQYCEMAHAEGKFVFMHSDGYIQDIIPDLIEIGVDALNSQLFCMDLDKVAQIGKGKITFWGEIDRQHILPDEDPQAGINAVHTIAEKLYLPSGGIIAQLEFGAGANPETVKAVYTEWNKFRL
ncbi:MAG: uroporphyrinogen decarboxylase family protein [Candidatus Stygibacter frigidus]|nr:uroporphyrinogen decarboxylase family protein [Candidatus Stygibacter frigidus]